MTETDHPPDDAERSPLTPRPPSLIIALLLFGALVYIATLDAQSETYDASYTTYGLIITIAAVLGVDLTWFRRK